ncbi:MAG: outer membrane beta-barrel protein [Acidobacteriota bacterium]|nr:outer membrane beta-barrel protein [Acidobacteriota bacterium]
MHHMLRSDFDAHDTEFSSNGFRDSVSNEFTLGLEGQLSPVIGTGIRLGYLGIEYDLQPGDPPISDFKGFIVNGFIDWSLGHGSVIRLDLLRSPYPSNYSDNANYLAIGTALRYNIDRGAIYASASGGFQNNDYELPDPQTGQFRSDDILTFGLGMGYRITRHFSLWGSYVFEDRDSLYQYSYTTNIYTLGLVLGF